MATISSHSLKQKDPPRPCRAPWHSERKIPFSVSDTLQHFAGQVFFFCLNQESQKVQKYLLK